MRRPAAVAGARLCRSAQQFRRRAVLVAGTRIPKLRAAGLSGQKVGYIKDLAAGFLGGRIRARRLVRQSNEDIIAALTSVKGIGQWTAEMFLIFSLNRLDVLPVDDLGIRKAVQRWYGLRGLPEAGRLQTNTARNVDPRKRIAFMAQLLPPSLLISNSKHPTRKRGFSLGLRRAPR